MSLKDKIDITVENQSFELEENRLQNLPEGLVKHLRYAWWWGRKTFFTKIDTKPQPAIIVKESPAAIERLLGRHYFEPGWELSYNYKGEILNLRRAEFVEKLPYARLHWWQTHLRGYVISDGDLVLTPHFEPDPSEHPDAHISQKYIIRDRAVQTIKELLNQENIRFKEENEWRHS